MNGVVVTPFITGRFSGFQTSNPPIVLERIMYILFMHSRWVVNVQSHNTAMLNHVVARKLYTPAYNGCLISVYCTANACTETAVIY